MDNKKENAYKNVNVSKNDDLLKNHITSKSSMFNSLEKTGFKIANFTHKTFTLFLIIFTFSHIGWGLYKYNQYWLYRRKDMIALKERDKRPE